MKTRNMKRLVFAIVAIAMLLPMKALSATLKIEDFTIKPGETKTMLIDVDNTDMQVTMAELYMRLPSGLSVPKVDNDFDIDIAGRTTWKKHSLTAEESGDFIHLLLYSSSNATLSGTSGAVISVKLVASSSFSGGNIIFERQILSDPGETESKPADYTYKVTTGVSDAVTITARSYTRQYGEANPTFDYNVTSGTITSGTPSITCSATKNSPVGTYDIVISKGSVTNETVNLVNGTLTITKAPLTISAGNYTKQEGEANPTFTPTFSGFKNGETKNVLTKQPTVSTTATTASPAGTYTVTVSGAEAQNYSMSYVNGTLTVTAKPVVSDNITFADANVKALCIANWDKDGDGELSKTEAAAVTDLGKVFNGNKTITSFNELQYFTGLTSIGDWVFSYCNGLTSITIPNSVTSIEGSAFWGCSGLTSVTIPNTVTSIGGHAFYGCSGLTSVTIPNSVTSIGDGAFYGCSGLTSVTIPNSVTSIGMGGFYECSSLTSVIIPNSVRYIGLSAFSCCSSLISIKVESGNTVYDSRDNCNAVIKTATNELIAGCQNTVIPKSVTSIGKEAFDSCSGLTSVTIPNSVTSIGEAAFYGCSGLTSVAIPNSVTSIERVAFYGCSGLTTITIGSGLRNIYTKAFFNCTSLTDVYCYAENVPNMKDEKENPCTDAFEGSNIKSATLHVPAASVGVYKATAPWSSFKSVVELNIVMAKGDANGDGKVDIVDVTMTISYILGQNPAGFNQQAADVTGDGKVDIVDVTSIIDIILKK